MLDFPILERIGLALYGSSWQTELARDLGVSDRTIRYWVAGTTAPKPGVYIDLADICEEHARILLEIAKEIKQQEEH